MAAKPFGSENNTSMYSIVTLLVRPGSAVPMTRCRHGFRRPCGIFSIVLHSRADFHGPRAIAGLAGRIMGAYTLLSAGAPHARSQHFASPHIASCRQPRGMA